MPPNYLLKGKNSNFTVSDTTYVKSSDLTSLYWYKPISHVLRPQLGCLEKGTLSTLIFLPKLHNLNLIMRKHETNPN